jgi:hypothetical protein
MGRMTEAADWRCEAADWRCLVCRKWHPGYDPHVEMVCRDCGQAALGHPDDHEQCRDCFEEDLAAGHGEQ